MYNNVEEITTGLVKSCNVGASIITTTWNNAIAKEYWIGYIGFRIVTDGSSTGNIKITIDSY